MSKTGLWTDKVKKCSDHLLSALRTLWPLSADSNNSWFFTWKLILLVKKFTINKWVREEITWQEIKSIRNPVAMDLNFNNLLTLLRCIPLMQSHHSCRSQADTTRGVSTLKAITRRRRDCGVEFCKSVLDITSIYHYWLGHYIWQYNR